MNKVDEQGFFTMASTVKPMPKKAMGDAIAAIIKREIGKGDGVEYTLSLEEMIDLYAFFAPTLPKVPKTNFQWVAKAVASSRDVREYLGYVYVDSNGFANATDGHRLHRAPVDPETFSEGYYDTKGNSVRLDNTYPDVDRVIPVSGKPFHTSLSDIKYQHSDFATGKMIAQFGDNGEVYVSKGYLMDALSCKKDVESDGFEATQNDALAPLKIDYGDGKLAVIMPIRV